MVWVVMFLLLIVLLPICIWSLWDSLQADKRATERSAEQVAALKADGTRETQQPTATPLYDRPLSPSQVFLHGIRSQSCYPVLRIAHALLTIAAVVATGILWVALLNGSSDNVARIYASFVCGAVIVALLIEYGLFRLIVDAVDVLIDNGQRASKRE